MNVIDLEMLIALNWIRLTGRLIHKAHSDDSTKIMWQILWILKFHLNSDNISKIGNKKELRHFAKTPNLQRICHSCLKLCIFRQKWQIQTKWIFFSGWIFSNYFAAEFSRFFIGVKLSEFSKEVLSHFNSFGEFFVN